MKIYKNAVSQSFFELVNLNPNQIKLNEQSIVVTYSTQPLHQVEYHYDYPTQCINDFNIIRLFNHKIYS